MAKTRSDVVAYIAEIERREGATPNPEHYDALLHQALAIISERTRLVEGHWTNAVDGDLTLTGNTAAVPDDCLEINGVFWDENELLRKDADQLDAEEPGWRTASGTPGACVCTGSQIILAATPTGSTTGKLEVFGTGTLPDFSATVTDPNPLAQLPKTHQLLVADFVLAELPANPDRKMEVARAAKHAKRWETGLAELVGSIGGRQREQFTY